MKKFNKFMVISFMLLTAMIRAEAIREITVELTAPDATWSIKIEKVCQVGEELWVLSKLSQEEGMMGASVLTPLKDSVEVEASELPVKHYVTGKTWNWDNGEDMIFVSQEDVAELKAKCEDGTQIYP